MSNWKSKNRHKYLLQYHLIFVCKYRKKLLSCVDIANDIKQLSYDITTRLDSITTDNIAVGHLIDKADIHPVFLRLDSELADKSKKKG